MREIHVDVPADIYQLRGILSQHAKAIKELQEIVEKQADALIDILKIVDHHSDTLLNLLHLQVVKEMDDAEESDTFAGGSSVVD